MRTSVHFSPSTRGAGLLKPPDDARPRRHCRPGRRDGAELAVVEHTQRPREIAWHPGPVQGLSFAPYRPGQSPLTKDFPTAGQIEADLKLLQGKTKAVRTYTSLEGMEAVPRLAGKYDLKVWHGAWLNGIERENLRAGLGADRSCQPLSGRRRAGHRRQRGAAAQGSDGRPADPLHQAGQARGQAACDICRGLGILAAQPAGGPGSRYRHHPHPAVLGRRADRHGPARSQWRSRL